MSRTLRSPWLWPLAAAALLLTILGGARLGLFAAPLQASQATDRPAAAPQGPGEAPRYLGDAPALLAESTATLLRGTPEELVATVLAARERRDLAALARCCSISVGRDQLDNLDAVRAERDFFDSPAPMWAALQKALDAAQVRVAVAKLAPAVPGAGAAAAPVATARGTVTFARDSVELPEMTLAVVQYAGSWYFEVAP